MKFFLFLFSFTILVLSNPISIFAQGSKPSLSLGYETANFANDKYKAYQMSDYNNTPSVKFGLDFSICKNITLGGYINYTKFAIPVASNIAYMVNGTTQQREWFGFQKSNAFTLGTKINFKLLPFLFKERDLKVDIYSTAQFGLLYNNTKDNQFIKSGFTPEYGIGVGLGYSITKRLKIFGEYTIGKFYNDKNSRWTFGLKYSF
jgi:hypothetical protein